MKAYLIGYDLNRPRGANDYPDLFKAIKALGETWHELDSTWIVRSDLTAAQIRDKLKPPLIDSGDELLVAALTKEAAWVGFKDNAVLKNILRA